MCDASVWKLPIATGDSDATVAARSSSDGLDPDLAPILGEFAWHSLTADSRLGEVSEDHYKVVASLLADTSLGARDLRALEVAAYAHTTGYMLHGRLGAR